MSLLNRLFRDRFNCISYGWPCMFLIKSTLDLDFSIDKIDSETSRIWDNYVTQWSSPFLTTLVLVYEKICKKPLQISQNNCEWFHLQLEKMTRIEVAGFKLIIYLNMNDRFSQCVLLSIYKFFNSESPEYFNEIYFPAEPSKINIRSSFQWLK